ncbi:MAG: phosphomannomutase/phosphoglucomutase [Candidatus Methylomirabilales bacterium]
MNPAIFRRYDIRGIVGPDLNEEVAEGIGKAFGTFLKRREECSRPGHVAVGRDVRQSSPSLARAVIEGLVTTGLDVVDLGIVPTPLLYFYLFQHRAVGGVIVTGSHNPPEFNGFKICRGEETLYDKEIQEIRRIVEEGEFTPSAKRGGRMAISVIPPYLDFLATQFQPIRSQGRVKTPLRIVVDAGNGTAGLVAPRLLRTLGYETVELYCEPDGQFPHHHPDPTVPANLVELQSVVREARADLGVAYDGDADRLGVVDERGEIVWGDRLLILYARQVLREKAGAACIGDVKCSQLFFDEVATRGGIPLMWKTGHSLIKAKMKETGALLAGEMSGHFFFADRYFGFDDALYATCRLLEVLDGARKENPEATLSGLLGDLPMRVATPEIRILCSDEYKHEVVHRLAEKISQMVGSNAMPAVLREEVERVVTLDGLRLTGRHGWGLIRASNTEPALILRFEATSEERMEQLQTFLENQLATIQGDVGAVN